MPPTPSNQHSGQTGSTPREATRVLCVDDNALLVRSLQDLVESNPSLTWAGSLNRADELLEACKRECPDVVLLDIDMPGADPFQALRRLDAECPETRVIMLTAYATPEYIERAVERGAWGYVSKFDTSATLIKAIRTVSEGEGYFSPMVTGIMDQKAGPERGDGAIRRE
jgi:DNA-binding NarL/FixJ family response regulator